MQLATDSELSLGDDDPEAKDNTLESDSLDTFQTVAANEDEAPEPRPRKSASALRHALLFGLVVIVALGALVGWWAFRVQQAHQAQIERSQFLQAAKQSALNLTTINWEHAEADVQRILEGATGQFHDDFAKRSQPFVDAAKQVKATTVGTVDEAGLESASGDTAQVLVAMTVKVSNLGAPEQVPRRWRMRIFMQKLGDKVKMSNVEFVP
ncbi:mammalian cell entry protein [Mycobacterium sp. SM1]|uniref:mammalian cell entry protein n=1 Tax=Mycobacterium sp. SM1 TaxID=2816243 RepID=UPI001BCF86AD|nr:mammalian cell entry protein [Mycobacterium sp. SM1]MBS4728607.1 mammalian cell entry protein [Mycobacterium sp. SM1]